MKDRQILTLDEELILKKMQEIRGKILG